MTVISAGTMLVCLSATVSAQEKDKGRLSGSFETNSMYYIPDSKLDGYLVPEDRFGSNNYLKLDYTQGRLAVGIEYELYAPVLYGYERDFRDGKIVAKYASWTDKDFNITVGNFYDQFGSGMIFRSFEDRALGFNNSIEGVRVGYNYGKIFRIKGLMGRPRMFMDYADVWVRGLDASFALSEVLGFEENYLALEGSFVNRYEELPTGVSIGSPNTDLWSARISYENISGLFIKGEYVERGSQLDYGTLDYITTRGKGYLAELGYNGSGIGITATLRKVERMNMRIMFDNATLNNLINYIPSLTRQHTYMLASLEPHVTSELGEQGGQIDFFYNFRKGTSMGGRYGTKLHLNGSLLYPLDKNADSGKYKPDYADASLDIEKQWNSKFKTLFMYAFQRYYPKMPVTPGVFSADNIFVADMLYKFNRKTSLRMELQYLYSNDNTKSWAAGLLEANFAPKWSVFASDMYNFGNDNKDARVHYFNVGASFTHSRTRIALSFGRNRAGYICSGGVCRYTPAYTGVNLLFTTSF